MLNKLKKNIPLPVKHLLYKVYSEHLPVAFGAVLGKFGYNVSRKANFYSPLPDLEELKAHRARWDKPSRLSGVKFDIQAMKDLTQALLDQYLYEYLKLPTYAEQHAKGFGLGYTPLDALTLYLMIRHLKPKRYIEVGSGLSTYYCHLAALENRKEGFPIDILCIEPYPLTGLIELAGIELIQKEVQNVELSVFERLEDGDVLFIDSTHVVKIDGDVPYLFLDVVPNVAKGVNIHIHDIPFPYNTPFPAERWVFGQAEPMYWTEAMLVQALLAFNSDFQIELSLSMIRHFDEDFLKEKIPIYETVEQNSNAFSSLWIKRTSAL